MERWFGASALLLGGLVASCGGGGSAGDGTSGAGGLSFDADFIGKGGAFAIAGTVTLPGGDAAGRTTQIEVVRVDGLGGNQLGPGGAVGGGPTIPYRITGLEPGVYKVGVRVDATNDGKVSGSGDYVGFARGSGKTTSASADEIRITNASVEGVDLTLSVVP